MQGGRYQSPRIANILGCALRNGAAGIGQSSWGPTGFILAENETGARQLKNLLQQRNAYDEVSYTICSARNFGATVTYDDSTLEQQKFATQI